MYSICLFFFFKLKTAYEMRISDWSSDVCSSDLFAEIAHQTWRQAGVTPAVTETPESYTGSACIFIEEETGNNAIIVCPGAAALITPAEIGSASCREWVCQDV